MKPISFTVPGKITGWQRTGHHGGKGVFYTQKKTRSQEAMIRHYGALAMRGRKLIEGPVMLMIVIHRAMPKKLPPLVKKGVFHFVGRPDADNNAKLVMDALNEVVWRDDAQVSTLIVHRVYSHQGASMKVEITEVEIPA